MISVALIVKDGGRFIEKFLLSIDNLNIEDLELIVVDGGSTDETLRLVEDFTFSSNVTKKILRNKNEINIVESYNKAIDAASYSYLAMPGVDDCYLDAEWLSRCVKFLELNRTFDLVFGRSVTVDENFSYVDISKGMPKGYNSSDDQLLFFLSKVFMPVDVNMVGRTKVFKECFPKYTSKNECDLFVPHLTFYKNFFLCNYRCYFFNCLANYSISPRDYSTRRQIVYLDRERSCRKSIFCILSGLRHVSRGKVVKYFALLLKRFWIIQRLRLYRILAVGDDFI